MATTNEAQLAEAVSQLGLDRQNGATIGQLLTHGGGLAHAEEGPDGRMSATIRIPEDELRYEPSVLVMPHGGDLEIELLNDDTNTHAALLPSNGDFIWQWLPNYSRAKVTINLDGPGYYWYNSNIGNDEGRDLIGVIVVLGDAPEEARLDRPDQPRP